MESVSSARLCKRSAANAIGVVLTTLPDEARAARLAREIVEAELGACVQFHRVRSTYRWQGALCDDDEWILSIKTTQRRFDALAKFIKARHPYALPEIVMLPVVGGDQDYLQWVRQAVAGCSSGDT